MGCLRLRGQATAIDVGKIISNQTLRQNKSVSTEKGAGRLPLKCQTKTGWCLLSWQTCILLTFVWHVLLILFAQVRQEANTQVSPWKNWKTQSHSVTQSLSGLPMGAPSVSPQPWDLKGLPVSHGENHGVPRTWQLRNQGHFQAYIEATWPLWVLLNSFRGVFEWGTDGWMFGKKDPNTSLDFFDTCT